MQNRMQNPGRVAPRVLVASPRVLLATLASYPQFIVLFASSSSSSIEHPKFRPPNRLSNFGVSNNLQMGIERALW
jgi:hypothetical protein